MIGCYDEKIHQSLDTTQLIPMFNHNSNQKDYVSGMLAAALGAGVVTSFAVGRGQSPFLALGITAFAATAALLFDQFFQRS